VTVTILSQVSYIALIRGKPTVMLGYNQLRGKGITYEAFDRGSVEVRIKEALERGLTSDQRDGFVQHVARLTKYYLYDDPSVQKKYLVGSSATKCSRFIEYSMDGLDQHNCMLEIQKIKDSLTNGISIEDSIKDMKNYSNRNKELSKILFIGHIYSDNETDYLYQMAKRISGHKLISLNLHYRARYDKVYDPEHMNLRTTSPGELKMIKYFIAPELFTKNIYPRNKDIDITDDMSDVLGSKEYVRLAAENMAGRHWDIGTGYPEYFASEAYRYLNDVLDILNPKFVMLWNQFHAFSMIAEGVCRERGVKIIYMEFGVLPGTYVIETAGQMGESRPSVYHDEFKRLPVTEKETEKAYGVWNYLYESRLNRRKQAEADSKDEILKRLVPGRPTVFFAGQNDYESGLCPYTDRAREFHSPIFKSTEEAIVRIAEICKINGWNIIYKKHPTMAMFEKPSDPPENVIEVDADINDVIDISDVTVTILSQVSYIALIRGKPTVMLGYNQLRGKDCAYEAYDEGLIEKTISKAISSGFTDKQKKAFATHIAQLNKYYLLKNNAPPRGLGYGGSVGKAVTYLMQMMDGDPPTYLPDDRTYLIADGERSTSGKFFLEDAVEMIRCPASKVISFDLFDTLIERPVMEPTNLFKIVGQRSGFRGDFTISRTAAERLAGLKKDKSYDAVTLDEIYSHFSDAFGLDEDRAEMLKNTELSVEEDYLRTRSAGKLLFDEAVSCEKRILITTDTFFEKKFLQKILSKNGYSGYEQIYASCDLRLSKRKGRLYDKISEDMNMDGIRSDEILHIGDNIDVDFRKAKEHGILALHLPKAVDALIRNKQLSLLLGNLEDSVDNSFLVAFMAQRLFADPYRRYGSNSILNEDPANMGTLFYGPLSLVFVKWMLDDAISENIDRILFVRRDGYIPHIAYDILTEHYKDYPEAKDLYLNRSIMYSLSSLGDNALFRANYRYRPTGKMTIRDYIKYRIGAKDESEFKEISEIFSSQGYSENDRVHKTFKDVELMDSLDPYFKNNFSGYAAAAKNYVMSSIDRSKRNAVFDIGYRGRVCAFLKDEFGLDVTEYHMFARPEVIKKRFDGYRIKPMISVDTKTIDDAEILLILLDHIMSVQEPGVSQLEMSPSGDYVFHQEMFSTPPKIISDIQRETVNFVKGFADSFKKDMTSMCFDPYPIYELMKEFFIKPPSDDLKFFKDLPTPGEAAVIDPYKKVNIRAWYDGHRAIGAKVPTSPKGTGNHSSLNTQTKGSVGGRQRITIRSAIRDYSADNCLNDVVKDAYKMLSQPVDSKISNTDLSPFDAFNGLVSMYNLEGVIKRTYEGVFNKDSKGSGTESSRYLFESVRNFIGDMGLTEMVLEAYDEIFNKGERRDAPKMSKEDVFQVIREFVISFGLKNTIIDVFQIILGNDTTKEGE
jgi:FMN phosphatase YigB (HAD superfamily)